LANPTSWTPLSTNTTDANGIWTFTDTHATNFTRRFYRARQGQ
jgi:hypothetical protein